MTSAKDRSTVLLEIARITTQWGSGPAEETTSAFLYGISLGMRIGANMTPPECLALERAAIGQRHQESASEDEVAGFQRICSEQAFNVVTGKI